MNTVKKNRSLISIIIFLLLTNLVMLLFFIMLGKPANRIEDKPRFSTSLQKDVGFSKGQMDAYQKMRTAQFEKVKPLFNEVRNAKFALYDLLYNSTITDSAVDNAAELIGKKQKELDIQMFYHFAEVRKLCTPEQLPAFDSAVKKLVIRMTSRPGKNGRSH